MTMDDIKQKLEHSREHGRTYDRGYYMITPTAHQTMEMRGAVGSNDSEEVLAWAEFLKNVITRANRKSVKGTKFSDLLKGDRISKYVSGLEEWRKITKEELDKVINLEDLLK